MLTRTAPSTSNYARDTIVHNRADRIKTKQIELLVSG